VNRLLALLAALGAVLVPCMAQETAAAGLLLVPPTVYVGDRARLVIPVTSLESGGAAISRAPQVVDVPERLPRSKDVTIHRLELEVRGAETRILADFSAYAPGLVDFPRIEFGPYAVSGLRVRIASILDPDEAAPPLAPPLDALSPPGTAMMVYGTLIIVFLSLALLVVGAVRGVPALRHYRAARRRKLAWRRLRRVLSQLGQALEQDTEVAGNELAARLNASFRAYLGARIGVSCLALSPREFTSLKSLLPEEGQDAVLESIFRRCDELRFGHEVPGRHDLVDLKERVERCAQVLETAASAVPEVADLKVADLKVGL